MFWDVWEESVDNRFCCFLFCLINCSFADHHCRSSLFIISLQNIMIILSYQMWRKIKVYPSVSCQSMEKAESCASQWNKDKLFATQKQQMCIFRGCLKVPFNVFWKCDEAEMKAACPCGVCSVCDSQNLCTSSSVVKIFCLVWRHYHRPSQSAW